MFHRRTIRLCFVAMVIGTLLFTGCTKLTQANFEKLERWMDYSEVTTILGEANECEDTFMFKSCTWGSPEKSISVTFLMDKAIVLSANGLTK